MLALAIVLQQGAPPLAPPPWYASGRVLANEWLHVGIRPALFIASGELDVGFTLQVITHVL